MAQYNLNFWVCYWPIRQIELIKYYFEYAVGNKTKLESLAQYSVLIKLK